jgi:hydroxyacylglutathione hydrolase
MSIQIEPIRAFADNYIWLLRDPASDQVAVVDPGDAEPVLACLHRERLTLAAMLLTHHHRDHIGGVAELHGAYPRAEILAPEDPRIPLATHRVSDGEHIQLRLNPDAEHRFEVLVVPGHTATHVAYLQAGVRAPALFCGDTLFSVGCGRVFDGTPIQLAAALRRLAALPPATWCYCAHEYTLENIGFAHWVEPDNPALTARSAQARQQRAEDQPTLPVTLAMELATNPFLRVTEPTVIAAVERAASQPLSDPTEVFTALRRWKDEAYD